VGVAGGYGVLYAAVGLELRGGANGRAGVVVDVERRARRRPWLASSRAPSRQEDETEQQYDEQNYDDGA
jgi:hypothetical protein